MSWLDVSALLGPSLPAYPGNRPFELCVTHGKAPNEALSLSEVSMGCHSGTHVDAPNHFVAGGASVDRLALSAFFGPCEVVEIADPERVDLPELRRKLGRRRPERLLLRTRNSRQGLMSRRKFEKGFVYVTPEAARWLAGRGLRLIGVDYLSIERFGFDSPDTHLALLGAGIPIVEGLDLSAARAGRWELSCAPIKLAEADGAPARAALRRAA